VADLLNRWSPEAAPVRIVLPNGNALGRITASDEEHAKWVEEARELLQPYREHLFVVVDCHK
jgi:hypothetical protein